MLTAAEPTLTTIHYSPAGVPLSVELDGRCWTVVAEQMVWYERFSWWESSRMAKGTGRIDRQIMRLEVRLGHNPRSQTQTLELVQLPDGAWHLRDVLRAA